jgi:hypothetical protein
MRVFGILPATLLLGGCIHLGAKPMSFACGGMLDGNIETYRSTPLFKELQRDAGLDECPTGADGKPNCGQAHTLSADSGEAFTKDDPVIKALEDWRARKVSLVSPQASSEPLEPPVLMLSGGGAWGAFGAGYLNARERPDWAIVTGVSTGALQGMFVAAGDYPALAKAYRVQDGSEIARSKGLIGVVFGGSEFDIAPLRQKVMGYLLPPKEGASPLLRLLRPSAPEFSAAMVEARSGDLKVVHVTGMVRANLTGANRTDPAQLRRVADCVGGVVLASSSIPVRMTPVQIDGHTYFDGGVRSSVFDTGMGQRFARFAAGNRGAQPHIYVLRNGPTIVFRDAEEPNKPGTAAVDARPDAMRVGLRAYSTIVNQTELWSIAGLRLNYPRGPISVISADGFNSPTNPMPCGPRPATMFEGKFMRCLVDWGDFKARSGPQWIPLSELEISPRPGASPSK